MQRSVKGTIEVLTQAQRALTTAANRERAKRYAGLYRLHARECGDEIERLGRSTGFVKKEG